MKLDINWFWKEKESKKDQRKSVCGLLQLQWEPMSVDTAIIPTFFSVL